VLISAAEREGPLEVGADESVAENPLPVADQLDEKFIEICVRSDRVGRGHFGSARRRSAVP
jgi:hypothetical protein